MSYILDALRRSQAERDRGQVPGLNAQPAPADTTLRPPRARTGVWLGAGVAAVMLAGLVVVLMRREAAPTPASAGSPAALSAATGAAVALPATPSAARVAGPATAAAPEPAAMAAASPAPAMAATSALTPPPAAAAAATLPATPPAPAPAPLPIVVSAPPTPSLAVPPPPAPSPLPAALSNPPRAQTTVPAQAAEPRPIPLAQLTADQRRDLPALVVSGSIWSESASNRFVILNGTVVREGEAAAPGLTLERIGPKAAVLRWRDIRIELAL